RSIRPLFPKEYKKEVQIVVTVLSVDGENEPDTLALVGVSAALAISPIPWRGPIGAVRMGYVKENGNGNGEFLVNPGGAELALSELDLIVSQTREKTVMLEAGASQVPEAIVLDGIKKAHEQNTILIDFIEDFAKAVGVPAKGEVKKDATLQECIAKIEKSYKEDIEALIEARAAKEGGSTLQDDLINKIYSDEQTQNPGSTLDKKTIAKAVEYVFFQAIRKNVLDKSKRADGRKLDEIRQLDAEVSVLPRTHGSAIFARGDTQVLTVATLGSTRLEQLIESAEGEEKKSYIHHYSFPPYSVGETGRMGTPSRREIGHGALAERALVAVIPNHDVFPYTIRVVSEVLSSNGSTSMASTCGSTLALMDAGVPIIKPVAGISIGMMSNEEKYMLLTDILGLEDFSGDMDFKVAGTDTGITAIQLDVKNAGLTIEQIAETFDRAKIARMAILEKMLSVMPVARGQVSEYAPKIALLHIPVEKIGELIGPGGRTIKNIIATTGATVDVEDDGTVSISGINEDQVKQAVEWVSGLTREVTIGETFENSEVKRILPFGAFVEFLPGKEGMVHVSKMSDQFVKDPNDVVHIGQKVTVRVVEIDDQGRINLSMRPAGEDNRPSAPRAPMQSSGSAPAATRAIGPKPMHPLSMQFQRERMKKSPYQRGGSRGGYKK
ncbi:MAG: polyribonucleotide nucleotidyltransferase, partial [Candidatus Levyibacteriota bacterium]